MANFIGILRYSSRQERVKEHSGVTCSWDRKKTRTDKKQQKQNEKHKINNNKKNKKTYDN
jgi:hypothetical protein